MSTLQAVRNYEADNELDTAMIRVVVAVGPRLMCDALVARLTDEADLHPMAAPGTGAAALAAIQSLMPSVVVVDPEATGDAELELLSALGTLPGKPVAIGLVSAENERMAAQLMRHGAAGTVVKTDPTSNLITAIRSVGRGDGWISPSLTRAVVQGLHQAPGKTDARLRQLTAREREIVQLMVDGLGRQQIAAELFLSVDTVRTHLRTIMEKLKVHSATAVVSVALSDGIRPSR